MDITVLGNGSWATALVKILSDNGHKITWWMRNLQAIEYIKIRHHNPDYLSSVWLDPMQINTENNLEKALESSQHILFGIPSAYVNEVLQNASPDWLRDKTIISAIKGILPESKLFLNEFLEQEMNISCADYQFISGPCHAEEVAQEKISYLTISGYNNVSVENTRKALQGNIIHAISSDDVLGTQLIAVLKNIYALGAGIAHGLGYGDNFLSVYITIAFSEAFQFLQNNYNIPSQQIHSSVYLGDLLVTCYSLHSRNRLFGTMIGKGYSVKSAKIELGMVAEGYYASKALVEKDNRIKDEMPIIYMVYEILWNKKSASDEFKKLESILF